jgi:hypothetical protein
VKARVAIQSYRQAAHGAQHAIEAAVRGVGSLAVNSALLLLPPKVSVPLRMAVRAVELVVNRGIDLGLGR